MTKRRVLALFSLLLLFLLVLLLGAFLFHFRHALFLEKKTFSQNLEELAPFFELQLPAEVSESTTLWPIAVLFHGCGGNNPDYHKVRAERLLNQGYAVLFVDSYTGRGIHWRDTCNGTIMHGTQRSADVFAALHYLRSRSDIDPEQIVLIGYSHGGWTVLDALAYDERAPRGLASLPPSLWQGVQGIIAYYPFCGFFTEMRRGWNREIPVLMLLGGKDTTTDARPCKTLADQQQQRGLPIQTRWYPQAHHAFDVDEEWVVNFNPKVRQQALQEQDLFLSSLRESKTATNP